MNILFCDCRQLFVVKLTGFSSSSTACHGSLYDSEIDIWSFGCLMLDIFVGKCGQSLNNVWLILCASG